MSVIVFSGDLDVARSYGVKLGACASNLGEFDRVEIVTGILAIGHPDNGRTYAPISDVAFDLLIRARPKFTDPCDTPLPPALVEDCERATLKGYVIDQRLLGRADTTIHDVLTAKYPRVDPDVLESAFA